MTRVKKMPDGTTDAVKTVWEILRYPMVFIIGLLGWNIKRQVARVDQLEKNSISREIFNDTLQALRSDIKEVKNDMKNGFSTINQRIDNQRDGKH